MITDIISSWINMSAVDRSMTHAPVLYLSSVTCFIALLYMTSSNNIKALCIPHEKERKDEKNVLTNTKKNNAAYHFDKFNILY